MNADTTTDLAVGARIVYFANERIESLGHVSALSLNPERILLKLDDVPEEFVADLADVALSDSPAAIAHSLFDDDDDPAADPFCPNCGHRDLGMWAEDGEASAADFAECHKFSGGCGVVFDLRSARLGDDEADHDCEVIRRAL